jgi:vancomycin permeability regulator SanA
MRMARPARTRLFIFASLVLLVLPFAGPGAQAPPQAAKADVRVGIILGNAPAGTDEPTPMQTARCLKAYELYKNGTVNKLLVTGGFTRDYISEARMMTIALVTYGVAPGDIVEDELASSTVENGLFAARIFEARGWPKTGMLISQKFHLPRAGGIFKENGFQLQDAPAADAAAAPEDFAFVLDPKAPAGIKAEPSDLIVVYEPFNSPDAMSWPTPQMARRLRLAAALYHAKTAPTIVLYNDRYTRGPVNLAQMMKIGLLSLGVPAANVKVVARGEYRRLADLAKANADKSATVLTTATGGEHLPPEAAPKWKVVFVE